MSDNLTRYLAISNALQQAYRQACATAPCGNYRHHLNTLAAMVGVDRERGSGGRGAGAVSQARVVCQE